MATKDVPQTGLMSDEESTEAPAVLPYQFVIRMAHERALEKK